MATDWQTTDPGYAWPRNGLADDARYVLAGRVAQVPKKRSKVVRVFLSSTFTDTYVERNTLMQKTFPGIKQFCQDEYALDFQVVDMRWGVQDEASDDHSAAELCMRELATCQRLSVGPTFVTLIGQRYGSRPIPVRIPEKELNLILAALEAHGETDDIPHLKKWFLLDENAIPPEYILQSLSTVGKAGMTDGQLKELDAAHNLGVPDLHQLHKLYNLHLNDISGNKEAAEKVKVIWQAWLAIGRELWREAEPRLAASLRQGATHCIKEGTLTKADAHVFTRSVTDEEIENGIIRDSKRNSTTLCLMRTLKDINLKHPKAHRFIDQKSDGSLDEDALTLLNELKMEKIPKCLDKKNIFHFETTWSDNEGVNEEEHKEYITQFCGTLEDELKKLIEAGVKSSTTVTGDPLYEEVLEHAHQALAKCERFHGRVDILNDIKNYVMSDNRRPLIIHGDSGCGKTSIMAKAALMMPEWCGESSDLHIVLRFLGTTPNSSTIANTMLSVTSQIHRSVFGSARDIDQPQNYIDIKDFFVSTLDSLPRDMKHKRVVLVLDSLDQLSAIHGAHSLGWLPTELPSNVKLILSTLPEEHKILDTLRTLNIGTSQFIPVNPLNKEDCQSILMLWLNQLSRKITKGQHELVDVVISKSNIRPLYLKLIFDEISTWRSYESNDEVSTIQENIEKSILQLFNRLERKHGAKLVQRAFGYLTASKNGLTELEMEDLLSLDDEALDSVFEFHLPPIRRLPSILWARIRGDIAEYIVDREADGARVMAWYHRQFIEKANRYFSNLDKWGGRSGSEHPNVSAGDEAAIVENMYEYFLGKWSNGAKKPFKYTDKQMKKYKFDTTQSEADRYVSQQPAIFRKLDGSIDLENVRFNNRKVSEFPNAIDFYLAKFNDREEANTETVMATLFNWEFLMAWCACTTWAEIASALEGQESSGDEDLSKEVKLLRSVFLLCITTIYNNPYTLGPQIAGRMMPYLGTLEAFTSLINGIETEGRHACALVAPHYNLETPGGAMLYVINNHSSAVKDGLMFGMGLVSVSDKFVYVSMEQGEVLTDIRPRTMPHGENFSYLALARDKSKKPSYGLELSEGIACASLEQRPWIYIMECATGQVRETIHVDEVSEESFPQISGLRVIGKYMIVTSSLSPTILIFNSLDGSFISKIPGVSLVTSVHVAMFNEICYLIVLRKGAELMAEFYKIGRGNAMGDSSDEEFFLDLDLEVEEDDSDEESKQKTLGNEYDDKDNEDEEDGEDSEEDDTDSDEDDDNCVNTAEDNQNIKAKPMKTPWYNKNPWLVSLGKRILTASVVADNFIFAPFAFSDGTITFFLSLPGFDDDEEAVDTEDEEDSDSSHHSDDSLSDTIRYRDRPKITKHYKGFKTIKEIGAKMHTVQTDYYPIHNMTCLRSSVHEEMLLTISCTEHMLVVNEMTEGRTLLRVRKRYTDARVSGRGRLLVACDGGDIDIFRLYLDKPGLSHYASIDAHSRPIRKLGIMSEDFMFYSTSEDGSLKFWNTEKLKETTIPKFERAKDVIGSVCFAGSSPHDLLAVTYYPPSSETPKRSIDVWHVLSGRRVETIQSPKPVLAAATYKKTETSVDLITLVSNGDLLTWNIADLLDETLEQPTKRLPSRKSLLEDFTGNVPATMVCSEKNNVLYIVLKTGELVIYNLKSQAVSHQSRIGEGEIRVPFLDHDENVTCFTGPRFQLRKSDSKGKVISVSDTSFDNEIMDVSAGDIRYLMRSSNTEIKVIESKSGKTLLQKNIARPSEAWRNSIMAISPDGLYVLVACDRELRMIRVKNGRLLAWVTLYDTVMSINITPDSWFVILGMPDKRFFVLLISDPANTDHDDRITYCRNRTTGFDEEKTKAIADLALKENDSSDYDSDERLPGGAENIVTLLDMENEGRPGRSMSRTASTLTRRTSRMTKHSDDSSSEEEEEGEGEGKTGRERNQALTVVSQQLCNLQ